MSLRSKNPIPLTKVAILLAVSLLAAFSTLANPLTKLDENMKTAESPTGLMVDLLVDPEHGQISNRYPRFSWIVNDRAPNAHQVGYQIIVGSDRGGVDAGEGDMWDSGAPDPGSAWAVDGQSTHVPYQGRELESDTTYYWRVRTWNEPDDVSPWSETQAFTTGTLAHERPVDAHRMVYTPVPATEIQRRP